MLIQVLIKNYQNHTVADWDSMGRVVTQTRGRAFQTLCRVFDFLLSLQNPSVWKGRASVLKQALGRVFCSREFMKIWSVKSTIYSLQSSVINLFNLHFINNTYIYSLRHTTSYIPICCISYLCKIAKIWFNNQYPKKIKRQRKEEEVLTESKIWQLNTGI